MSCSFTERSRSPTAEELNATYAQMVDIKAIGRGVGLWVRVLCSLGGSAALIHRQGDMVITLYDKSKVEMRSVDNWQEVKAYIEARINEAQAAKEAKWAAKQRKA